MCLTPHTVILGMVNIVDKVKKGDLVDMVNTVVERVVIVGKNREIEREEPKRVFEWHLCVTEKLVLLGEKHI